jgi:uncharacterized membrane protein YsdA (DUF1294 family)
MESPAIGGTNKTIETRFIGIMNNSGFIIYLILINFISGIVFAYDKWAAISKRQRISELALHLLELPGGAFENLLIMYTLRHKNRKFSYWVWTWVIAIVWLLVIYHLYSIL